MSERYVSLYTLPKAVAVTSGPVVIIEGALIGDRHTGSVFAQLKLRNVQNRVVKGVTLQIRTTDRAGNPLGEESHSFAVQLAGGEATILITPALACGSDARQFSAEVTGITYADGTVQAIPRPMATKPVVQPISRPVTSKQPVSQPSVASPTLPKVSAVPETQQKPKKRKKWLLPVAAVLVCAIAAAGLLWKFGAKKEGTTEIQGTVQTETAPMTPEEAAYAEAETLLAGGETAKAAIAFGKLGDYADARERSFALWREIAPSQVVSLRRISNAAVRNDGTVLLAGYSDVRQRQCLEWTDIIAVSTTGASSGGHTVGLKKDGTVVAAGANQWNQCDTSSWSDIVAIDTYDLYFTLGLKSDGTVVYTGSGGAYEEEGHQTLIHKVSSWKDIAVIRVVGGWVFGIKIDGTVVVTEIFSGEMKNKVTEEDFKDWSDIIAISGSPSGWNGDYYVMGLKADGTVVQTGSDNDGQYDVSKWSDIIAITGAQGPVIGLKSDGTVVSVGLFNGKPLAVSDWTDIAVISAYNGAAIGVKNDGSVVLTGDLTDRASIKNWTDVKLS